MVCGAMAQNEAMYVYRNSNLGKLTFLKSEIDSVVCSQVDLQGQRHEEYVVQEIWTRDSVYRTLLSTIDSVSFATVVNTCPDAHHPHAVDSRTAEWHEVGLLQCRRTLPRGFRRLLCMGRDVAEGLL